MSTVIVESVFNPEFVVVEGVLDANVIKVDDDGGRHSVCVVVHCCGWWWL